ncbi:MAG TPA: hypothetical protein VG713_06430 [Pirellulales bacterium]|nr:hypothetical protein [Pirellulales bacterium]
MSRPGGKQLCGRPIASGVQRGQYIGFVREQTPRDCFRRSWSSDDQTLAGGSHVEAGRCGLCEQL